MIWCALRTFFLTEDLPDDQTVVVEVNGDLDLSTAPNLERRLRERVADGRERVVVDLSRATFLDSTALGALVNAARATMRSGGRFAVQCPRREILRVLELTGLARRIAVRPTRAEALAAAADGRA